MKSPLLLSVLAALLIAGGVAYLAFHFWRRQRAGGGENTGVNFRPSVGFTRLDGWASLALLLVNKSESLVWAEEFEIALSDLIANDQTSEASCHEIQKIHQTVREHDMLPISLVEAIYKAAGRPQRKYSCLMSSIVRYRVGKDWFEKPLPPHKLEMAGLTVVKDRRERRNKCEVKRINNPQDAQVPETKPSQA